MSEDGYSLKWKDHPSEVFNALRTVRQREAYSDIVLHCGGRNFLAHKLILASASTFFERLIDGLPNREVRYLVMTETKPDLLERVLEFIYEGETFVDTNDLEKFIDTAEGLEIRGLRKDKKKEGNGSPLSSRELKRTVASVDGSESLGTSGESSVKRPKRVSAPQPDLATGVESDPWDRPASSNHGRPASRAFSPERGITVKPVPRKVENIPQVQQPPRPPLSEQTEHLPPVDATEDFDTIEAQERPVKLEAVGDEQQNEFLNDPADVSEYGEDGALGEEEDFEGQYDGTDGGWEEERPQNIPPEVSTDHPITQSSSERHVWRGTSLTGRTRSFCGLCSYSSYSSYNVIRHVRRHTGEKPFACPMCPSRFRVKSGMLYHVSTKHGDPLEHDGSQYPALS